MKIENWMAIGNLIFAAMLLFMSVNVHCRDPYEFEPIFDSLTPPPGAPALLHPCNDTVYRTYTYPNDIIFEWSYIDGAQLYMLDISKDSMFEDSVTSEFNTTVSCCTIAVDPPLPLDKKRIRYWRVRAYSRLWWWYTDWSEVWHFNFERH